MLLSSRLQARHEGELLSLAMGIMTFAQIYGQLCWRAHFTIFNCDVCTLTLKYALLGSACSSLAQRQHIKLKNASP